MASQPHKQSAATGTAAVQVQLQLLRQLELLLRVDLQHHRLLTSRTMAALQGQQRGWERRHRLQHTMTS